MTDGPDHIYSGDAFSTAELRAIRRKLAELEDYKKELDEIRPLVASFKTASTIGRGAKIVFAWLVGAAVTLLGAILSLKELGWWPPKGGGP